MTEAPFAPPPVRSVTLAEGHLIRVARAIWLMDSMELARLLTTDRPVAPPCLSPNAVELLQESFRKGFLRRWMQDGAWQIGTFLHQGRPRTGRVYEQHPMVEHPWGFSRNAITLLLWLATTHPAGPRPAWELDPNVPLTVADQYFVLVVYRLFRHHRDHAELASFVPIQENPWVRIVFPADFPQKPMPDFRNLLQGPASILQEGLQPFLEKTLFEQEHRKQQSVSYQQIQARGEAETETWTTFCEVMHRFARPDLAQFLFRSAGRILKRNRQLDFWRRGFPLRHDLRLADRLKIERLALALPRMMEVFSGWEEQSRRVSFYDEDYAVAQWFLREYEEHSGAAHRRTLQQLLQQLDPLAARPLNPPETEAL
ncbi:MAG: hypothetical protein ACRCZF_03650 [Gemmataceae bacterium]